MCALTIAYESLCKTFDVILNALPRAQQANFLAEAPHHTPELSCVNSPFHTKYVMHDSSTDMIADGSSSGSAVAVSANIVPLSFGTETDTSIIGPASINGVVGIKPTVGLTSRAGVIPISKSMDTVGSFGRTVADAVHGLNAIVGIDERDAMTCSSSRPRSKDYSKCLTTKTSLKGARFGLPKKRCWELVTKDIKEKALDVLKAIEEAGASVVEVDFPCAGDRIRADGNWDWTLGKPSESEFSVVKVEAFQGINSYLSELSDTRMKTLEDIIEYNRDNSGTEGAKPGDYPAFPSGQVSHDITITGTSSLRPCACLRSIRQSAESWLTYPSRTTLSRLHKAVAKRRRPTTRQ